MSEAREPRTGDTIPIPPGGSQAETGTVDSSAPPSGVGRPPGAPTLDPNPDERGPAVVHTDVAPTPSVNETVNKLSPSMSETLGTPSRVHSTMADGGFTTDAGSAATGTVSDDEKTDEAQATPGPARGPRSSLRGPAVPGYEIIAEIGRGGMGVVYKARHVRLDRLVALKMILAGAHASTDQIARFHIEARAVAQIQHPGIVQIHEDGDHEGLPYFSLEFVPGGSLAQLIGGKPQPPRAAAAMVIELCRAMAEAHARGIIHRDLKPANVLLTLDGKPKITDFGLAKQMAGDSEQTHTGAVMGTPSYMAPEQAWGETHAIGPLSDQYSLGAILYEMLVGRPPFQGATTLETLELARNQEPVAPTRLQPKVPADLETICLKALQKDPAKRFPDVAAMAADLRSFLDGEPIVARPVGAPERLWRWCMRNPRVAVLAAAVVLMGLAITAGSAAFAVSLKALNGELAKSYRDEANARAIAQTNERTAITAKNEAIAATKAEAEAREKEKQAREKAEALVQGAFAQNRNALEAQRVLSILLNQRLLGIPGTQGLREELINTTLTGLEATMASLEQLGTVARDKEGFALGMRALAGVNQRAGQIAMEYGKYDETARYFRRMEELAEQLAAADPDALEPQKVKASVKATLGDFQMDRIGDAEAALKFFDQALALRRQWLARETSSDEAKRGVANILGAIARARLQLGDPAKARDNYREEIGLRDQFSPDLADQVEVRRERAGLSDKLGDLSISLGEPRAAREHFDRALALRREIAAQNGDETQAQRDVLLSLQRVGNHELIYARDPKSARQNYQEALDGFLLRLKAEPTSAPAKFDVALAHYYVATADLRAGDRDSAMAHYRACRDIRAELAKDSQAKLNSLDLMLALARTGDHARASEIAEAMIKEPPLDARIYFHSACGFALSAGAATELPPSAETARLVRHYSDRALNALRLALNHGWRSIEEVATDPDLDPIRADPEFKPLLNQFRKAGP
jgi:tetratricopeptide (TPR) repeat protein/tRNA A-37 threonylcarbamoyl transferase component Bud32